MRAKDLGQAYTLSQELRDLYGQRDAWGDVETLLISGKTADGMYGDRVDIPATPDILAQIKSATEAQIADLEQQLDAMGVKDLYTLQEAEDEDGEDEDEDDLEYAA